MFIRLITISFIFLILFSCKWKTDQKQLIKDDKENPLVSTLKETDLPCFKCHDYEKFSSINKGRFSHTKHINFVHCNQCHIIKAHHSISLNRDLCNECHKLTNFTYTESGMPVNFTHQNHAKRFNCTECHPSLFQMKKGTTKLVMEDMYKGNSCGVCHNGKKAFSATSCNKCHRMAGFKKQLSYPSGGVSPAIFSHEIHTSMFECTNCHTGIFNYKKDGSGMKMDTIYKGKFCGQCHNGQTAFGPMECKRCHK